MNSSDNAIIIQIILLLLLIFGYFIYQFNSRRLSRRYFSEDTKETGISTSPTLSSILQMKAHEKQLERITKATTITNNADEDLTHIISLPDDIELIETVTCLVLKGSVQSIREICNEIEVMEQLPSGSCMRLGDWRFFVMEDIAQSSREEKLVVMPPDHWLFMSCKFRDSIMGEDIHPYNYVYEPFTFKKVLDYGVGVEATDL